MQKFVRWISLTTILVASFVVSTHRVQAATTRPIIFPVLGAVSYSNDYGNARVGHTHIGNDLLGKKMQPLLAAVTGTARVVAYPEPSYGYYIELQDAEGYRYVYIHINNDTPGTDDNKGGGNFAYAPGVDRSYPVVAGQVIAYMGDSGNAENTHAHLHFEIHNPEDTPFNPYYSLQIATKIKTPVETPSLSNELLPFSQFHVGSNIATGDISPSFPGHEVVIGSGLGSRPQVRIITPTGDAVGNIFLPQKKSTGGVDVAVGDVNADGTQDIITGLGPSDQPWVQVVNPRGVLISKFLAYDSAFRGGVRVATADLDGDGRDEIITGSGAGMSPEVRVFDYVGNLLIHFPVYSPKFGGGIDVAGIMLSATEPSRIVTAPGKGGGPDVRVYSLDGVLQASFWSGDSSTRGGVRVATAWDEQTGQTKILTVPMSGSRGIVREFTVGGTAVQEQNIFERWWTGGFDVAVGGRTLYSSTANNNRRGSIVKSGWAIPYVPGYSWWTY